MKEYKILVVEEDDLHARNCGKLGNGAYGRNVRPFWLADYVVVRKNDGTCETIKDRFEYPDNFRKAEIYLP